MRKISPSREETKPNEYESNDANQNGKVSDDYDKQHILQL